jgi:DinB superfamily
MTQIAQQDFLNSLFKLLKETFEEGGSYYLEKSTGLFQTLEAITPEAASRAPVPGAPTVAAHCAHVSYYVRVLHRFIVGQNHQEVDWPSSWRVQHVGPGEWEALKSELRSAYETLKQALESVQTWGDDLLGDSMAVVAHTAYHLGAIRQVVRVVQS